MEKVSIVCPVYKTEKFIRKCVDSIIHQTFTNWELVLVIDGSPDNSGAICDEYAKKDSRIIVKYQNNQGSAVARQVGLNESSGEYIVFVDSDDWIDEHMLEFMLDSAIINNSNIVVCDNYNVYSHNLKYMCKKPTLHNQVSFLHDVVCSGNGILWNKLFKRECFLIPEEAKFEPGVNVFEDLLILCKILMYPRKISYVNKPLYYYNQCNINSYMKGTHMYDKRVVLKDRLEGIFNGKYPVEMNCIIIYTAYSALIENALNKNEWINKYKGIDISDLYGIDIGLKIALKYNYYLGCFYSKTLNFTKQVLKQIFR